jgi:hypothetical protein
MELNENFITAILSGTDHVRSSNGIVHFHLSVLARLTHESNTLFANPPCTPPPWK